MKSYKPDTPLHAIKKSGVVGIELKRTIDTMEDRERRDFINSRRLKPMDGRYKIGMCAYGSCREEFYLRGDSGCGSRKYCRPHSKTVELERQRVYRKENKAILRARNISWKSQRPGYAAQHYQKNKEDIKAKAKTYRENNRELIRARRIAKEQSNG
jgi:hypothetical protein